MRLQRRAPELKNHNCQFAQEAIRRIVRKTDQKAIKKRRKRPKMSLFGSLMGDIEDDPFFGSHMNMMRQMNTMMSSFFGDPFGGMGPFGDLERSHRNVHNSLMPFSMPMMPNFNRLLSGSLDSLSSHSYSSSTVVSMSSGPDGRPQVYKATSSTRTAPGGVKETQRTVTDTRSGTKKMAIGHHIGERAHIIEKEQNVHTGDREERQDFINLEEDEAEDFNKEWESKARSRSEIPRITSGGARNRHSYGGNPAGLLAITGGPRRRQRQTTPTTTLVTPRRGIRSSPLVVPLAMSSSLAARTPYSPPAQTQGARKSKNVKTVSGSPPPADI